MWHLIGRSMGTHLSLCVCLLDCWLHIESSWYYYPWFMLGYCIRLRHWHVDYIDWSFRLSSYIDSPYCMITLLTLTHTFFLLLISFILTWLILLVVYYHDYHVDLDDLFLFCVIAWCMTTLFLHDACIAYLIGSHTYPFISNSLVSVELVFLDLVFHMSFLALFALRLS